MRINQPISSGKLPGDIVQVQTFSWSNAMTGSTLIPYDDTQPQSTEGDQYATLDITPQFASSLLLIEYALNVSQSIAANTIMIAIWRDLNAGASMVSAVHSNAVAELLHLTGRYYQVAGSLALTTFKLRAGVNNAATLTVNGTAASRLFGGVLFSTLSVTEIKQ